MKMDDTQDSFCFLTKLSLLDSMCFDSPFVSSDDSENDPLLKSLHQSDCCYHSYQHYFEKNAAVNVFC